MRDEKGRFKKGHRASPDTEFKPGQHWRSPKPYWNRGWLYKEYITEQKSAAQIASEQNCTEANILYFLHKLNIPIRTMSEIRATKYWGLSGEVNGMFGRRGIDCPNWKGGSTPERQALYSSQEWAQAIRKVWARDRGICQRCDTKKEPGVEFHIHHIVPFRVTELRTEVTNLILVCKKCHKWIHSRKNTKEVMLSGRADEWRCSQDTFEK